MNPDDWIEHPKYSASRAAIVLDSRFFRLLSVCFVTNRSFPYRDCISFPPNQNLTFIRRDRGRSSAYSILHQISKEKYKKLINLGINGNGFPRVGSQNPSRNAHCQLEVFDSRILMDVYALHGFLVFHKYQYHKSGPKC